MEWQLALLLILLSFVFMMLAGLPVAFSFLLVTTIGVYIWWGGEAGLRQLTLNLGASLTTFAFMPLPLFFLMGYVLFGSGIAPNMIDALDKWLGRLPGRLGLLAVASGTVLSTLTGASIGSIAMLGSSLVPEMEKRGYKKSMSLGPILGSGGLAMMIPPSGLAVLLGVIGEISIGQLLIAIIIPGLLMAVLYASYIIVRSTLQPSIAPPYDVPSISVMEKIRATALYILPTGLIIFMVTGVIFLGVASPSEAAATGVAGTFILAALYKKLNWKVVKESFLKTIEITVIVFMIIASAKAFSQILAFSGATQGVVQLIVGLPVGPILVIILMQVILIFLGMFMPPSAMMMISLPLFMPIIDSLGFNPVWFGVIFLINVEMAGTTPPYGIYLFLMKEMATPGTTLGDCIRAASPFLICDVIAMAMIVVFPSIALWLPGLMFN